MNELGIRSVVVPLDGTSGAERALPYAGLLARRLDAEVQLLAVAASPEAGERLRQRLGHAHTMLAGQLGESRVAYDFSTSARIVAATAPADAVACMATDWSLTSSIARRVMVHSIGPVLLVGPKAAAEPLDDGVLLTTTGEHPGDLEPMRTATSWSSELMLPLEVLRSGPERSAPATPVEATVVDVVGRDLTTAVLERATARPVTMIAWAVPAGRGRLLGRRARNARRLIRTASAPVLAVPSR